VSLNEARERAREAMRQVRDGIDPIEARKQRTAAARLQVARAATFADCAGAYIEAQSAGWRNAKHAAQWRATLETYAFPVFGSLPVSAVDTGLVMKALDPIWRSKTETATRVRGRIESVLDWAKVRGYRDGENPARWRGHLDKLLPQRSKVAKVKHHPALPYAEIGAFMRERPGIAPKALEYIILTAVRVSEAVNAIWAEINPHEKIWTVPGKRMKSGREHRVPLSTDAVAVLEAMKAFRQSESASELIFPGWKKRREGKQSGALTGAACLTLLDDTRSTSLLASALCSK
jgi:integrase